MTTTNDYLVSRGQAVRRRREARAARPPLAFVEQDGVHVSTAETERRWRIRPCVTGWRLEFRDPGDVRHTNAGVFSSVQAAMREASR